MSDQELLAEALAWVTRTREEKGISWPQAANRYVMRTQAGTRAKIMDCLGMYPLSDPASRALQEACQRYGWQRY